MPRAVVTPKNLSKDFTVDPLLVDGPVLLNLSPDDFKRRPVTGLIGLDHGFATRADLKTWQAANTPSIFHVRSAAGLDYVYIGAGTYIADMPGWHPLGETTPNHMKDNTTPKTTDMGAAINAAIQYEYLYRGGGVVRLRNEMYATSETIEVPQRVKLLGVGGAFANVYINSQSVPLGCGIFALAGMNADIVVVRGDVYYDAGVMRETGSAIRNSDQRFFQEVGHFVIYGNRSVTAEPTVKDTNTAGRGLVVQGCRKAHIHDMTIMYCADAGFWAGSYDYGAGNLTSTNLTVERVACLSCYGKGFEIYSGDHTYHDIIAGFCGDDGIYATGTGHYTNCAAWNCRGNGVLFGGASFNGKAIFSATRCYDNDENGFFVTTGNAPAIVGLTSTGNGRADIPGSTHNVLISEAAQDWMLSGVSSAGKDYTGTVHVTSGIKINSDYPGTLGSWQDAGSPIGLEYPQELLVTSITGGVLACGRYDKVVLDIPGGETISSITMRNQSLLPTVEIRNINPDPVNFTHNNNNIRTLTGGTVSLAQLRGFFVARAVSPTIVQQR